MADSYIKFPITVETLGTVNVNKFLEFIISDKLHIVLTNHWNEIEVDETGIYEVKDASYHGSPNYYRKLITDNKDKIDAYTHVIGLLSALNRLEDKDDNK